MSQQMCLVGAKSQKIWLSINIARMELVIGGKQELVKAGHNAFHLWPVSLDSTARVADNAFYISPKPRQRGGQCVTTSLSKSVQTDY